MFIASTGGHLNELMQIKPLFKKFNYHIITEKTKVDDSFKEEYQDKISFLIYGTKKYPISYIFKFIANCFISLYYFFKYQPEVVVTTGTHTAVPMCYIAKIFGSKVIFIETFANRTTGTVSESCHSGGQYLWKIRFLGCPDIADRTGFLCGTVQRWNDSASRVRKRKAGQ